MYVNVYFLTNQMIFLEKYLINQMKRMEKNCE